MFVLPFKVIRNKKGFTLVELIVVMAVLAIISAIAVPRFLGVQEKAKVDADYATGAMIAKAAEIYKAKNQDALSVSASDLISGDYMNEIEFMSKELLSYDETAVDVSFSEDGLATVTVDLPEGTDDIVLYPR